MEKRDDIVFAERYVETKEEAKSRLKKYVQPELAKFERIEKMTMGGSPGLNDSGSETTQDLP